jgi:hypothetical protein
MYFAIGCVMDHLNINYAQQIQNNSLPNCSIPWLISLLGIKYPKQEIVCSPDDESNLRWYFIDLMKQINKHTLKECLQPCNVISYTGQLRTTDLYSGVVQAIPNFIQNPRKLLYLYYHENEIEVSKQTKLVTFNGFISSFGGSLGLFLGFSCLPTLFMMKKFIKDRIFSKN